MKNPLLRRVLLLGTVLSLAGVSSAALSADVLADVLVDPTVRHQTMSGWEVTGRLWQFDKANDRFDNQWESYSDQIFDKLVNELGINRFRLEALSGLENPVDYWSQFHSGAIGYTAFREHFYEKINDNGDPYVTNASGYQFAYMDYIVEKMLLPIKQRVEANGEKLYINLNYVDFMWTALRGNIEHATNPEEYAEIILASFEHLNSKYGIVPDALEIVLEADNTFNWSGQNIGIALLAAKARLNGAGFYPEFIGPSTANAYNAMNYFNGIVSVPGAGDALSSFSYHRYDSVFDNSNLYSIAAAAQAWNLETGMLEHVGGNSDELLDDLLIANVSSWQQYGIATNLEYNQGGYYYKVNLDNPSAPRVYLDSRAAGLSMIFRHVRIGAQRVEATTDNSAITPVAFVNTDQSHVLSMRSWSNETIDVAGLPYGDYSVIHAASDGTITEKSTINFSSGSSFPLALQAGLTTLHGTAGAAESAPVQAVDPVVSVPVDSGPEPVVVEPVVEEPAVVEPAVIEPSVAEPAFTEPVVTEPAVIEPSVAEPAVSEPVVVEPAMVEPSVVEPVVAEPEITEPEVTEPEPVAIEVTEPVVSQPQPEPVEAAAQTPEPVVTVGSQPVTVSTEASQIIAPLAVRPELSAASPEPLPAAELNSNATTEPSAGAATWLLMLLALVGMRGFMRRGDSILHHM